MLRINRMCNEFEAAWQAGRPRALEDMLSELSGTDWQAALRDLLPLEIDYRQRAGQTVAFAEYAARFPDADPDWLASLFYTTQVTAPATAAPYLVPERLGDYQLIGRIGGGGMGTVYKALHVRMGRVVALKVLRPEIQQNPVLIQRFDREVRAVARLSHPNIVSALDAREQDGLHFLITEYIEGLDLEATVRGNGPFTAPDAVAAVIQAARGLDYAHRQGVVHRDIKPANLLRNPQGVVKVLDMGLARLDVTDTSTTATDLTNSGMVLGTAAYMAPEQARDVRRADARSDIYSLGCTLFYLLTGRHAFTGATALDTVMSHISQPIPALANADASFPHGLEEIFRRMVAKDPADRFQTAADVVTALEALESTAPRSPQPVADARVVKATVVDAPVNVATVKISPAGIAEVDTPTISIEVPAVSARSPVSRRTAKSFLTHRTFVTLSILLFLVNVVIVGISMFRGPETRSVGNSRSQEYPVVGKYALSFNGVSSYAVAPKLAPLAGKTYTVEAVVEPEMNLRSNVVSWLGPDWMALYLNEDGWGLARRVREESHLILANRSVVYGQRVHLAGVFSGTELRLFVNGKLAPSETSLFTLPETRPGLYVGGVARDQLPEDQNERFFKGRIHAVRITRGARYASSFAVPKSFTADSQTVALYQFHAGDGDIVKDASGNGHDIEIVDGMWTENAN